MPSTVLVTGAAGFVGSNLCARLIAENYAVRGLDDLSDGSLSNLNGIPELDLIVGDLRSWETVNEVASDCDVIFHQGAIRSVERSIKDPVRTTEVNVGGTLNVLRAARANDSRVIFASSSSVYGEQDGAPLHEGLQPRPRSPYAATKLTGEIYLQTWWRAFRVPSVSLRYFNVYGPGQNPASEYALVIPRFIAACLGGTPVEIHGDGEQSRDFTFIDDVIEANMQAWFAGEKAWGRVLNVGGGRLPTTINQLLDKISALTGTRPEVVYGPPRPGDVRHSHADLVMAESLIGYQPGTDLDIGLKKSVEWFTTTQARRSWLKR
jgi:nucleoside-diphosphate-sugar epimerase